MSDTIPSTPGEVLRMTPAVIAFMVLQYGLKYGPEIGLAIANAFKTGATIDDAIAALTAAQAKTIEQYVADAEAAKAAAEKPPA